MSRVFIDSFSEGCFDIRSESGKQGFTFDDSNRFGPSKVNMRTGDLSEVPAKHWFWRFYGPWREAGRPTDGVLINTANGPLQRAVWATSPGASVSPGIPASCRDEPKDRHQPTTPGEQSSEGGE